MRAPVSAVARTHPSISWQVRLLLAIGGIIAALAMAEAGLRVARFHFDLLPTLQFGWPDPVALHDAFAPDADLVWVTRDYRETLRGARRTHPATVFMGDSCTQFGSYPSRTLAMLAATGSPLANGVKLGVAGWSSTQGLTQWRRDVLPLHPRVITVYYGWNDHWIAYGMTDPEIARAHRLLGLAGVSRLAQLWLKLETNLAARRQPRPNRVPIHDYETNLADIAREATAAGVVPVLITAPSNHVPGHEPPYLAQRHVRALAELVPLHTEYTEATRSVAQLTGAHLCDAAAAFAALPEPHDRYFQKDGIHLTDAGDQEMARVVSGCLAQIH